MTDIKYGGSTASENFVHALACTLHASADSTSARDVTLAYGPRAGTTVRQFCTPYSGLVRLVGNALKPTTLKALVNRHPSLSVQNGLLTVRLPVGHEANPFVLPAARPWGAS